MDNVSVEHIADGCKDECDGMRPSGYPCRCSCHRPESYRRPLDGSPLYGEPIAVGSSERVAMPCLACSDHNGLLLVGRADLAEHWRGHVVGYAAYLAEQEAGQS